MALKPFSYTVRENITCNYYMVPVAYFHQGDAFPVSESPLLFSHNDNKKTHNIAHFHIFCLLLVFKSNFVG